MCYEGYEPKQVAVKPAPTKSTKTVKQAKNKASKAPVFGSRKRGLVGAS